MTNELLLIQCDPEVPAGVFADLLRQWQTPFRLVRLDLGETLPATSAAAIILGGRMGAMDDALHPLLPELKTFLRDGLATGTPIFGICLGGQLLAAAANGTVHSNHCGEKGLVAITVTAGAADPLFAGLAPAFAAFAWHNDSFTLPPGARQLATSVTCPVQAFRLGNAWGVQFHPEVDVATVSVWSRTLAGSEPLAAAFAAAEAAHREVARHLLGRFLATAENLRR